ncbi:MAG: cobyric acid synthase, partial [Desulfobulbaceae bacterium]|nr:cobyric acid synthase [Desulfobulbaceae bacterium]
ANAKVLLVGDIDRGGVFASFVGTIEVLDQWERDLIAGYVVNRFRGDKTLLADAFTYMLQKTGKPVLGTVDYLKNLGLPEEDSVSFKEGLFNSAAPAGPHVTVAMIDLPHISNFTDVEPFLAEPDVHLRVVRKPDELGTPDAIILPGSKNVIADLKWLHDSGMGARIGQLAASGTTEIVGICGGFQILGRHVDDPHQIESAGECLHGLGLIEMTTVLEKEKTLVRQQGFHLPSGLPVHGYEIHHGQSRASSRPILRWENGETAGIEERGGKLWGSYLHGIFDADPFRRWFIDRLRTGRGLAAEGRVLAAYDLEPAFDRLAQTVRAALDMDVIYKLLGR